MILERLNHWAREAPGKTALIHNDRRLSFAQLARMIEMARRGLAAEAMPPGGVVAVLSLSHLNAWVLTSAARALGLTTVSVSSLARAKELGLRSLSCLICAEDERVLLSEGDALSGPRPIMAAAPTADANSLEATSDLVEAAALGGHILYTSGTTGAYKKLLLEASKEDERARVRAAVSGFSPQTVFQALDFGLWTGVGFKTPTAAWREGGCVVIDQTSGAYANFLRHRPNFAQTLPESLKAIVAASAPNSAPTQDMVLRVGGGFTPLALAEAAVARVSTTLIVGFSATELTAVKMKSQFRSAEDLLWLTPVDPEAVQIVDEEGAELPPGADGELRFQLTETDSTAYLDDPEATAAAFRNGCFYSGDLAVRREDGRVRILGRVADVINIKGQKLPVGPMEHTLQQALGVDEVCLFLGLASDGVEELVVAVRSSQPPVSAEVLRRLGPSKIFDRVRVEVFADFPRTSSGTAKTKRTELRRLVFPD